CTSSGRSGSQRRTYTVVSTPRWASDAVNSRTYTFIPPLSPTPGCSNGEEWRETTARRVTEKFNAPTTLKIPSNPSNPSHPRAHPTVTGHIPQLRVQPGTIRRSARASSSAPRSTTDHDGSPRSDRRCCSARRECPPGHTASRKRSRAHVRDRKSVV